MYARYYRAFAMPPAFPDERQRMAFMDPALWPEVHHSGGPYANPAESWHANCAAGSDPEQRPFRLHQVGPQYNLAQIGLRAQRRYKISSEQWKQRWGP